MSDLLKALELCRGKDCFMLDVTGYDTPDGTSIKIARDLIEETEGQFEDGFPDWELLGLIGDVAISDDIIFNRLVEIVTAEKAKEAWAEERAEIRAEERHNRGGS